MDIIKIVLSSTLIIVGIVYIVQSIKLDRRIVKIGNELIRQNEILEEETEHLKFLASEKMHELEEKCEIHRSNEVKPKEERCE